LGLEWALVINIATVYKLKGIVKMKKITVYILLFFCSTANSEDWGQIKSIDAGNSVVITSPKKTTTMIWPSTITPGKNIVLTSVLFNEYGEKFYSIYQFLGIIGNSMLIKSSGSTQPKNHPEAIPDTSFDAELYIEKSSDGAFYFEPDDAEGYAVFIVTRNKLSPAKYNVELRKFK
jgi:hypothetical protein